MKVIERYKAFTSWINRLRFLPLFAMRIAIAYALFGRQTAAGKDDHFVTDWIPGFSTDIFSLWLIVYIKVLAIVLLTVGFATRIVSVSLVIILFFSVFLSGTVNGLAHSATGLDLPVSYILMLFTLFIFGGGTLGIDYWLKMNWEWNIDSVGNGINVNREGEIPDLYCRSYEDF